MPLQKSNWLLPQIRNGQVFSDSLENFRLHDVLFDITGGDILLYDNDIIF